MTTGSQPSSQPTEKGYTIEKFVGNPLGKLLVGVLTPLTRVTVMKRKDKEGKVVEKTPLDNLRGTVIAGVVLLVIIIVAVRIAAVVS